MKTKLVKLISSYNSINNFHMSIETTRTLPPKKEKKPDLCVNWLLPVQV